MRTQWIFTALALGIGIGVIVMRDDSAQTMDEELAAPQAFAMDVGQSRPVGDAGKAIEIDELRQLLESEIRTRRALERQVEELGRQVAALQSADGSVDGEQTALNTRRDNRDGRSSGWFDADALIDSGMDSVQAGELQRFYEELEMQRLKLRDQSQREGWNREQLRTALDEVRTREQDLRLQLGESGYDAYLYASGQPNRVAVTSVLASAQAGQAGIEAGDHILRYDDQRIYNWFELREATAAGDLSDTVSIEVDRDGETLQFYLARGPLGIRMNSVSVAP